MDSAAIRSEDKRRIRSALHHIISYVEFLNDAASADTSTNSDVRLLPRKIIDAADAALQSIEVASREPQGEAEQQREKLRERLLGKGAEIGLLIEQFQVSFDQRQDESIRTDLGRLRDAAVKFRDAAQALGVPQTAETDLKVRGNPGAPQKVDLGGLILVVDDNEGNRDVLSRRLLRDGCEVLLAETGRQALRMVPRYDFDVILLDIMMPEMNGYEVLQELKRDARVRHIPVIMISAVDEIDSVVRCVELGADDYLYKPFNPTLLRARIRALLERNELRRESERRTAELDCALQQLKCEQEQTEKLLRNILPVSVAEELQLRGAVAPRYFEDVTIVFTDFVHFSVNTEDLPTEDLVHILNRYFSAYDEIVLRYKLEKLKTIGDSYMFVGGMPIRSPSHPVDAILAAIEVLNVTRAIGRDGPVDWQIRIGIHTGPVAAGVVGMHKFAFDVWGDTVNMASRMEASSLPGRINVSHSTYSRTKDFFSGEKRGVIGIKEGRVVPMYFINGIASSLLRKEMSPEETFRQRYRTYFQLDVDLTEAASWIDGLPSVPEKSKEPA